jgi:hypothetical protein
MLLKILLLSQIEVNVAIISASAPALRPLFSKTFLSSYNQSNQYGVGYGGSAGASNMFSAHRSRSKGQIELHSINRNEPIIDDRKSVEGGISRNTSEEYILQGEGITKTVETRVNVESRHDDDRAYMPRSPF